MFNFLVKYAVRMFFLAFVIWINIRFFFCVQLDPLFHILCVQKENKCVPGRNDALWIHLWYFSAASLFHDKNSFILAGVLNCPAGAVNCLGDSFLFAMFIFIISLISPKIITLLHARNFVRKIGVENLAALTT